MNRFHILTLFPKMVMDGLNTSIIGRAIDAGLLEINAVNIRDYSTNKHMKVDDYPYGGGAGLVMQPEPVYRAYKDLTKNMKKKPRVVYLTPQGTTFHQEMAKELAKEEELVFLCGHYEGIDERVLEEIVTDYVSIGDYVLTGGELPAMVMIDSISRLVPGVLHNDDSAGDESFENGLLEYPQYTRPPVFLDKEVPEVLLSGHHENIRKWRHEQSVKRTKERRPDLWKAYEKEMEENNGTSKIRLVAVDMDGTLLNRERKITQYTQNVIRRAVSQGVVFAPATGRAVNALPQELKDMEEIRYGIFSNGATIYDLKEKKVLYKNQFEQKRILELMDFLKQFDVMQSYSMNGQSYAARKDMENVDYYQLDSNTKAIIHNSRKLINDLEDFLKEHDKTETVEKITLLFRTKEERAKVWKALERFDDIQYSSSLPKNIEISKKGCNKGDGLLHLAKSLGIKREEVMGCGDADNDRELLECSGFSVAMENGIDEIKEIADYITVTNEENGVAKAMEKFVLI